MSLAVFFLCLVFITFLLFLFCLFLRLFNIPKLYKNIVGFILGRLEGAAAVRRVFQFLFLDIDRVIDRNVSRTARTIVYCLGLSLVGALSYPLGLKFFTVYLLTFLLCTAGMTVYSFLLDRFISALPRAPRRKNDTKSNRRPSGCWRWPFSPPVAIGGPPSPPSIINPAPK